jgi:hypothetical protein
MTLRDASLYFDYAARNPTVRSMVAGYLGIEPAGRADDMNGLASIAGTDGAIR